MACAQQSATEYLRNCRRNLVTQMRNLPLIIENLYQKNVFNDHEVDDLKAERTEFDKARSILDWVINKGEAASYELLRILDATQKRTLHPDLHSWISCFPFGGEDTGVLSYSFGTPKYLAQASSQVLEIESRPQNAIVQVQTNEQNTEEKQIRWNKSSKRHRAKLEELLKETDFEKVGNLRFCKGEKYMISSGRSGTQVYIGLCDDGIEVAVKLITRNPKNNKDFENELKHLQDLKLESKYIVRYVTCAVGKDFYYLANKLCEFDLVDYMEELRRQERNDKENILRKIVKEMLFGLQVLHSAGVIHRDIKPRNVLIDTEGRARLADFGISRKLEEGKSTVYTDRAGTQGWEATEIVNQTEKGRYKKCSDIQVAGMLTYYILSDEKHPFGDAIYREGNILKGEYSLNDVQDKKATDLVEWMISKEQENRPRIDKVIDHPYFWDDKRIKEVLHNLGNKEEVQEYKNYESNKKLYDTVQKYTEGKSFSDWRSKAPQTWTKIGKSLPNDLLGLLRHLRNALGHQEKLFYTEKMIDEFPDFLTSLHRLATDMGWKY